MQILRGLRDRYERTTGQDHRRGAGGRGRARRPLHPGPHLPDKAIDLIDEAASRMRIKTMTAPPRYRELEEEIEKVRDKEEARSRTRRFEKAASLATRSAS